jgi:hypothetical protein
MLAMCSANHTTILSGIYLKCENVLFHRCTSNGRAKGNHSNVAFWGGIRWLFVKKTWTIMPTSLYWNNKCDCEKSRKPIINFNLFGQKFHRLPPNKHWHPFKYRAQMILAFLGRKPPYMALAWIFLKTIFLDHCQIGTSDSLENLGSLENGECISGLFLGISDCFVILVL